MGSKAVEKERVARAPERGCVEIRGARQNNLKGLDLDLSLGKLTVITGPSGSGKSSLAFDTIYAEGQRRYVETFSPYMRQFLDRMDKPRVDDIRGIPPAIAIEQSNPVKSSRSTVGTMTEINDYLKLLWPRIAQAFCPSCGREIRPETAKSIADQVFSLFSAVKGETARPDCHPEQSERPHNRLHRGGRGGSPNRPGASPSRTGKVNRPYLRPADENTVLITFWVSVPEKTKPRDFFELLQQQGYLRLWLNGEIVRVDSNPTIERLGARVQVIQDRIAATEPNRTRLTEAIETALRFGKGKINVIPRAVAAGSPQDESVRLADVSPATSKAAADTAVTTASEMPFSTGWHCAHCDLDIRPPTPGLFSFNNPLGACPECRGFGRTIAIDLNKAIPDRSLSIAQGAVRVFRGQEFGESQKDLLRACAREEINIDTPFEELPAADQRFVIDGEKRGGEYTDEDYESDRWYGVRGFFRWLESNTYKMHVRVLLSRYRAYTTCPSCHGGRFQPEALNYRVVAAVSDRRTNENGDRRLPLQLTLPEFAARSISEAGDVLREIEITPADNTAQTLRTEICARLNYLCQVGLGYLTLDRSTRTLSGGEAQRVNLTTCLGASLVNTLFVMDEPSVGLHPRDVGQLVRVMHNLRDKGNTLLVVEHEEQIIRAADNLIDIGPGRGERGGELVWSGTLDEFIAPGPTTQQRGARASSVQFAASLPRTSKTRVRQDAERSTQDACAPKSLTREYLSGRKTIPLPKSRRKSKSSVGISGAREHNLKNIDIQIPLGVFTCVTGVSGSGKSTLIHDVLYRNLLREKGQPSEQEPGLCKGITGAHRLGEIVMVDQSALARTPRSTPILYLGLYDRVRELFAALPEAMSQGLTASAFSFNSGSGRCERCSGTGFEKIEMQFLSDLYVRCAECEGRRFQSHVLKIQFHGKSIHDVLELTVTQAAAWFAQIGEEASLSKPLEILEEVGLGYLRLGQPLNTLSGGESQRLKLVRHLTENRKLTNGDRERVANLFIFDEPTTGLHFDDIAILLQLFQRLVDAGHSLLVIEHNLEVIKCADWIIDLGPEAGAEGGEVVAVGTPEEVAKNEHSHTGRFLKRLFAKPALFSVIPSRADGEGPHKGSQESERSFAYAYDDSDLALRAAEEPSGKMPDGARKMRALPL
ncbi:MAG: excinuclease subunit, partial [Verrucomicrobiota bacterium]